MRHMPCRFFNFYFFTEMVQFLHYMNVMAASDHQALSDFVESYDGIFGELIDLPLVSTNDTLAAFAESHGMGFDFDELSSVVESTRSEEGSAVGSVGFDELSSAVESRENSDTLSEEGAIEQKPLVRKRRGRPPRSKNKPKPLPPRNVLTFVMPNFVQPFTIEIPIGCEVLERVMNLARGNYGVCILKGHRDCQRPHTCNS